MHQIIPNEDTGDDLPGTAEEYRAEIAKYKQRIAALKADADAVRAERQTLSVALIELMRWTNESPPQWLDYEMHDEYRAAVNQAKDVLGYARRHAAQPEPEAESGGTNAIDLTAKMDWKFD